MAFVSYKADKQIEQHHMDRLLNNSMVSIRDTYLVGLLGRKKNLP